MSTRAGLARPDAVSRSSSRASVRELNAAPASATTPNETTRQRFAAATSAPRPINIASGTTIGTTKRPGMRDSPAQATRIKTHQSVAASPCPLPTWEGK
jgi:hypothetical protein